MRYLFITCTATGSYVTPMDLQELRYAVEHRDESTYRDRWPGHGHGPEWRLADEPAEISEDGRKHLADRGWMVIDVGAGYFPAPMTLEQLRVVVEEKDGEA